MRNLLAPGLLLMFLSNAAGQEASIKFGLWEGTMVQRTTVAPSIASILQQKSYTVPVPFTYSYRVCMDRAKWLRDKAAISNPGPGCLSLRSESHLKSMASSATCKLDDGTSVLIGADIAWESGARAKATITNTIVYPGTTGTVVVETKLNTHFLASGCGHLAPGKSERLP
jgi:hypothetical protein